MSTDWTFSWACCQAIHHNSSATDWLSQCVCLQGFQSPPGQWSLGWDRHRAVYGILSAHVLKHRQPSKSPDPLHTEGPQIPIKSHKDQSGMSKASWMHGIPTKPSASDLNTPSCTRIPGFATCSATASPLRPNWRTSSLQVFLEKHRLHASKLTHC